MLVRNKWNKHTYTLVKEENGKVTLKREDGTQFTIAKADYNFNYFSLDKVN